MNHARHHRLCELFLKRQRRKARRRGDQAEADDISIILNDELACCALCCKLEERVESESAPDQIGAVGFPFLQFLLLNWPAIMEMIKALIELFRSSEEEPPI